MKNKKLIKEIAAYGEMCYRRGAQQAVEMNLDRETASILRHKPRNFVYEIQDRWSSKNGSHFKFIRNDILYRFKLEARSSLIDLLKDLGVLDL